MDSSLDLLRSLLLGSPFTAVPPHPGGTLPMDSPLVPDNINLPCQLILANNLDCSVRDFPEPLPLLKLRLSCLSETKLTATLPPRLKRHLPRQSSLSPP